MITEDYVSFETAKLLKQKGFDCANKVWYSEYTSQFGGKKYISIKFDNHDKLNENYKFICYAPTLQMAMKWLREKYNIIISITPKRDKYYFTPWELWDSEWVHTKAILPLYDTYEEACEAAIKYALENLI